jgi:tetratricopeptide (TPR) repeat protein
VSLAGALIGLLLCGAAIEAAVSALSQPPDVTAAEHRRVLAEAEAALEAGRRAEAKALLAAAADRLDSARALLQLARLQSGDGDAAGALATLDRARALAPNAEEVLSAVAQVSLAARAPVRAIRALVPLTRLAPTVAPHHYLLGVAFMQAGDMPEAVEALLQAERLDPAHNLTSIALGIALNNRKMFDDARPRLLRALDREPDNVEAMAAMAETEEGAGDLDAAERRAARTLASAPTHPTANLVAGMVLMKRGRYAEAREALDRAAAADPESPKAYYQLSLAYARLGDAPQASRHQELYQQKLRAMEARIEEIRSAGVLPGGGLHP